MCNIPGRLLCSTVFKNIFLEGYIFASSEHMAQTGLGEGRGDLTLLGMTSMPTLVRDS